MRLALGTVIAMFALAALAVGFPPLEVEEVTRHTITLGNLDCDTRYEVRVRERQNERWRDARTITRTTDACVDEPPPPEPPPSRSEDCYAQPSACGLPDETNTGVPPGTSLTPSGSRTVITPGAVLDSLDITGQVAIAADNVTIRNSLITASGTGNGSHAVRVEDGVTGTTIQDTTIRGRGTGSETMESAVWNHHNEAATTSIRNHFYRCSNCWEGAGIIRDTYMVVDSIYSGAHAEPVYVWSSTIDVDHSTLINHQPQTAAVFGDNLGGGGNLFTVTDSLLAGGGYLMYPQSNVSNSNGTTVVTGNRFARCLTAQVYNPQSGGRTCSGGPDVHGIYPNGGYFGVVAYNSGNVTWANNVWDDNSATVNP